METKHLRNISTEVQVPDSLEAKPRDMTGRAAALKDNDAKLNLFDKEATTRTVPRDLAF